MNDLTRRIDVPAASGRAVRVRAGELVRVVDVAGGQVGDVFVRFTRCREVAEAALADPALLLHRPTRPDADPAVFTG